MTLLSRIDKLEVKLKPKVEKIYFIGWKDCEWRKSEGLVRGPKESKDDFLKRVRKTTDKTWIWCD
jgi:hypothetical protein